MRRLSRTVWEVAGLACVAVLALFGVFMPVDNAVRDLRFAETARAPSGDIVFLAIDPSSLEKIGVWPWPRAIHGHVIDKLVAMQAAEIFVDIDFSTTSNEQNDAYLESSLENAGGFTGLAAFAQPSSVGSSAETVNVPIARFSQYADLVVVNVAAEADGDVRSYPYGKELAGELLPSVATYLSGETSRDDSFLIDFSIDAGEVDQIFIAELLWGSVDASRIRDKQIVIGASALELRDTLTVPRFGNIPGPLLQVLAAETLKQNRALFQPVAGATLLVLGILGVILVCIRKRFSLGSALLTGFAFCAAVEIVAVLVQGELAILFDSVACHAGLIVFALVSSARELDKRMVMLRRTALEREATQNILNRVIADNFDGVVVAHRSGKVVAASRFAEEYLGFDAAGGEVDFDTVLPAQLAADMRAALDDSHAAEAMASVRELDLIDAKMLPRTIEYVVKLSGAEADEVLTSRPDVACLTFRDVTERRAHERRLRYFADHDELTGALSRRRFAETIGELAGERGREELTVYMVDLSRFKTINNTLGHDLGDVVLKQVAGRLKPLDVFGVARMGGDTFAVLQTGTNSEAEREAFARRMIEVLTKPYIVGEHHAIVGARVGISTSAVSGFEPESLIAHADMALSEVKSHKIGGCAHYRADMQIRLNSARTMEIALGDALSNGEFYLTFQPQVDLADGRLTGAEALIRWQHPTLGMVSPAAFVGLAEETGMILPIGRWVLHEACREAASWSRDLSIAVNVSPLQFTYGDIVGDVAEALRATGLPPERLAVEITESLLISDTEAVIADLGRLRGMGIKIAIDDFGTGFSSMSYLQTLPVDEIKIDQAFVRGLPGDKHSVAVVEAVMTLSQSMDRLVVAEGIETNEQVAMLKAAGCHTGQGYHFGKPMKGSEFAERYFAEDADASRKMAG